MPNTKYQILSYAGKADTTPLWLYWVSRIVLIVSILNMTAILSFRVILGIKGMSINELWALKGLRSKIVGTTWLVELCWIGSHVGSFIAICCGVISLVVVILAFYLREKHLLPFAGITLFCSIVAAYQFIELGFVLIGI